MTVLLSFCWMFCNSLFLVFHREISAEFITNFITYVRISWTRNSWSLACFLLLIYLPYCVVYCLLFSFLIFLCFICFFHFFVLFVFVYLFIYLFTFCKWLAEGPRPRPHQTSESANWRCDRLDYGHCRGTTGVYCQGRGRKNSTSAEKKRSIWLLIGSIWYFQCSDWKLLILQTVQW